MADTLKQFSDITDKTLSELTAGVTLVTTGSSEKAVIKGISIENPKARKVDITLNTLTGTKIANAGSTTTLSGNEILDNSQSLIASTGSSLVFTDAIVAGWGEGNNNNSSDGFPISRTNADGLYKMNTGATGAVFTPDTWSGTISGTNRSTQPFPASSDDNARGKSWGESWEDKFGNLWIIHTASNKDFEINGTDKSRNVLYKLNNDASQTAANNLKTFGNCSMIHYDGERYLYAFCSGLNYIKKYDTHANPNTDTFTQVPLYNCAVSDTTALTISLDGEQNTSYYRDGYVIWVGEIGSGASHRFSITELATGKTKALFDTQYTGTANDGKQTQNYSRRTLGMTKDSNGDYFAWIANWSDTTQDVDNNFWCVTNMGSDPKTTYIPYAQGSESTDAAKKTYEIDMWSCMGTPGGGDNNHYRMVHRTATLNGEYFDAPRGATVHTPGVDRYNYITSEFYWSGSLQTMQGNYHSYILDFDQIGTAKKGGFCSRNGNTNWRSGSLQLRKDQNQAADAFGKLSFRTTGILVT